MVVSPEDYPWSSYRHYAFGENNNLLTEDIFYHELANYDQGRQAEFRKIVVDQSIGEYMDKADSMAVGDKKFIYNVNRRAKYHETNKNISYRKRGI